MERGRWEGRGEGRGRRGGCEEEGESVSWAGIFLKVLCCSNVCLVRVLRTFRPHREPEPRLVR